MTIHSHTPKTLPAEAIRKIKNRLPSGGIKRITEDTGYSEPYVSQVLNGKRWNKKILLKAKEVILAHEKEMDELVDF